MDMSENLQMLVLNFVKTLHGTGNITKSLEKVTPCRTTYENSEISRLSEVKGQRRFHGNEPVQNEAISVVISFRKFESDHAYSLQSRLT